jgi:hypothetical protein
MVTSAIDSTPVADCGSGAAHAQAGAADNRSTRVELGVNPKSTRVGIDAVPGGREDYATLLWRLRLGLPNPLRAESVPCTGPKPSVVIRSGLNELAPSSKWATVRFLQSVLLAIGGTALGTVLGYFGLILVIALMQRPGGEPWQAGFGQYLGGLLCGAPFGSLVGLTLSLRWIRSRDQSRVWSVFEWFGVVLGLAMGPVMSFRWNVHRGTGWWGTAVVTAACGIVGGLVAGVCLRAWQGRVRR